MDNTRDEDARKGDEALRARVSHQESKSRSTAFESNDASVGRTCKPSFAAYVEAGLDLLPVVPNGKRPCDKGWPTKVYDTQALESDFEQGRINLGIRLTADVVVLDIDPRNFVDGDDSLLKLILETGLSLRDVPHTVTGSGGSHYWFSKPVDVALVDSIEAYPGVEFKSLGRQVVAVGSTHPCGGKYAWEGGIVPDLRELPCLSMAVLELAKRPLPRNQPVAEHEVLTTEQLAETLEQLDPGNFRDQGQWLNVMMACHHATNGEGRTEFIDWSTSDPEFADHAHIIGRRWDSLHASGTSRGGRPITVKYLHKVVQAAGGAVPHGRPEDDFDVVEVVDQLPALQGRNGKVETSFANCMKLVRHLGDQLGLAFDEFGRATQLTAAELPWTVDVGRKLDDDVVRRIRQYLVELTGMSWSKEDVWESVLTLARENPFHPVRDYLDGLAWDGTPRLDGLLVRYAGAADSDYVQSIGAKTLIAAVRRVRDPGCKFDNVIVLEGSQGCGKSSFVKALSPNVEWFSDSPIGNTESKDAPLSLQGRWIIELGEMSVLTKSGVEALKAFVSSSIDHVRRPYGRLHEELRRQCIFIGTTNQDAYLKDQTGNRRFWPVRVASIDLAALHVDRDQLWAEAATREAAGESILLPKSLWGAAAEEQEERVADDPWADILRTYLDGSTAGENGAIEAIDRVHTSILLTVALGIRPSDQTATHAQRLKVVMTKQLGWAHKHNVRAGVGAKQGRGYQRG